MVISVFGWPMFTICEVRVAIGYIVVDYLQQLWFVVIGYIVDHYCLSYYSFSSIFWKQDSVCNIREWKYFIPFRISNGYLGILHWEQSINHYCKLRLKSQWSLIMLSDKIFTFQIIRMTWKILYLSSITDKFHSIIE